MLIRYRKPTARIVNNVGIWHDIMVGLARIAVITNAFLIAVTSDFIPRLVYTTYYSQTGSNASYRDIFLKINVKKIFFGLQWIFHIVRNPGGLRQLHSLLLQHLRP